MLSGLLFIKSKFNINSKTNFTMKAISNFILVMILVLTMGTTSLFAQTAKIQIIHNSADALAQSVDIYVNDSKLIENFQFRTATKFFDVPAGIDLKVTIIPRTFETPNELQWEQTVSLERDEQYIIVANGLLDETRYTPFQPFAVYPFAGARTESINAVDGNLDIEQRFTDVLVFHGSTDAPNVNVVESGVGAGTIISDFAYGTYAGYLSLPTNDYVLQVTNVEETVVVAQYAAPLKTLGLENMALTVLASGFLSPADNYNGSAFGLYVALPSGGDLIPLPLVEIENRNTARVQVIHNSADAAAAVVDVWLDDTKLIENFAFRTATPFIDAPAGVEFTIAIQGPGSTSPANPIWSQNYTLADGETYVLVANGIVSASGYEPSQPFDIYVYAMGQEAAMQAGNTDVLAFHGSTDAPTVSVWEVGVGAGEIISDFSYGDFAGYLELPTLDFVLEVRDETGTVTVAAYAAPLATLGLEGAALSVIASGFLNPANNSNGEAFGLYVALPSGGDLIALPAYVAPTARVQVIHNSADAAAAVVDVWLDDTKLIENFAFRTATPFIDAPAGVEFTIAIQGSGSTSPENPIWSQNYTLADGETYVLVANGIVSASGYEPSQPFDIYVYGMGQEAAMQSGNTDVLAFHGSTDAPTVTVYETGVGAGQIISDFSYGDFTGYLELPTLDFVLEVRDETGTVTVAAYAAPLATLGLEGAALSVIASGFLNPANNSNGEAFGLYVALPSGGDLIALPAYVAPTARVQVIHNSADAAAAVVDVWLDDTKLIENFGFRTATPFIDAPAGVEFTIAIQGPGSTSPANPIWSQNYTLADGETYVLVANGIVSASGYEPSQPFDIYVYGMGQEAAMQAGNTDVLAFHGSTDAPTVTVFETGVGAGEIISDFSYGDFAGYLELPTTNYSLQIRDAAGENAVATFSAPLETFGLAGQAITLLASGFLNPTANSNGAGFGLFAALAVGGNLVELTNTSSINDIVDITSLNVYPNPVSSILNINFNLKQTSEVQVELYNLLGSKMVSDNLNKISGSQQYSMNVGNLPEGIYMMVINAGDNKVARKVQIVR
jgi:hypothetical protein